MRISAAGAALAAAFMTAGCADDPSGRILAGGLIGAAAGAAMGAALAGPDQDRAAAAAEGALIGAALGEEAALDAIAAEAGAGPR